MSRWRSVAYAALLAVAALLIAWRWTELSDIWRNHGLTFVVITILMFVGTVVQARNFRSFLPLPNRPSLAFMTRIWALATLANYLGPFQPGLAVRVAMLARAGVSAVESSIATARHVFASLWLSLFVAGVSLLALSTVTAMLPACGLLLLFVSVSLGLPTLRRLVGRVFAGRGAAGIGAHVEKAMTLPTLPVALGVMSQFVVSAAVFYVGYRQFGAEITVASAFGLASVLYATSVVAVVPGNFGMLEALLTLFGRANDLPVDQALALAFLFRGANLTSTMLLAAIPISGGART